MRENALAFAPVMRTQRKLWHYRWFHIDGTRCHTPHDECRLLHRPPVLVGEDESENLVMTAGLNELLDGVFNEAPAAFAWYCLLVDNASFSAYAAGDTLANHAGWLECTTYTGNRPAWVKNGAAAAGAMSNSSSKASYSINNTKTVRGAGLAAVATGTAGILYGAGDFASPRAVESGDTLTLQVDLSAAAA
jgi:hypothetical protein